MTKGQGVICINYVDDKVARNPVTGIPNNVFFDAYEIKFIHNAQLLSITQTFGDDDLHFKTSYIPLSNIEKIIIVPEEDIKKFVIQRADHEDLVINVNGGTYRDE